MPAAPKQPKKFKRSARASRFVTTNPRDIVTIPRDAPTPPRPELTEEQKQRIRALRARRSGNG